MDQSALSSFFWPVAALQRAIAAFLDAKITEIDALIEQAGHAIALLGERRSALITAAVIGQIDVRGAVGVQAA